MWRRSSSSESSGREPLISKPDDEGDWRFAEEWWGQSDGKLILLCHSDAGNGVVTVFRHPSSTPEKSEWSKTEKWLQETYADVNGVIEVFKILRCEWRVMKFNHTTPQSVNKVMVVRTPGHTFDIILPHCLAAPYLRSMVSTGLSAISCSGFNLASVMSGDTPLRILCVGHGGGSLPLFLASKIKGAVVDSVEIDPVVMLAREGMGFPSFPLTFSNHCSGKSKQVEKAIWKDLKGRLFVHGSDATEDFILKSANIYDMVFIDAYDGKDTFPSKLWDPKSRFLTALKKQLHPGHGTVVVNLHSDVDATSHGSSLSSFVSSVCKSYKNVLVGNGGGSSLMGDAPGVVFTAAVPHLCNSSLVVLKGFRTGSPILTRDSVLNNLASKCDELEGLLNLPFSCLQYLTTGFDLVD